MPTMMTIVPAKQQPDRVSAVEWDQIKKRGPVTVPGITALQAVRSSKGGYQIKAETKSVNVGVSLNLDDMPNDQLKLIVMAAGKRIGKKKMTRPQLIALARTCVEKSIEIVDDGEEIDDGEDAKA